MIRISPAPVSMRTPSGLSVAPRPAGRRNRRWRTRRAGRSGRHPRNPQSVRTRRHRRRRRYPRRAAEQDVVSPLSAQHVVAVAAEKRIVAAAGPDLVPPAETRTARCRHRCRTACRHGRTLPRSRCRAAVARRIAAPSVTGPEPQRDALGRSRVAGGVRPALPAQDVAPGPALQRVVAVVGPDIVNARHRRGTGCAAVPDKRIGMGAAAQVLDTASVSPVASPPVPSPAHRRTVTPVSDRA
jgi:hypothetical protein